VVPYFTTLAGAQAACMGMRHGDGDQVYSLQALHSACTDSRKGKLVMKFPIDRRRRGKDARRTCSI
jgi:hypothetical protein